MQLNQLEWKDQMGRVVAHPPLLLLVYPPQWQPFDRTATNVETKN
jgi:hypothetical protein